MMYMIRIFLILIYFVISACDFSLKDYFLDDFPFNTEGPLTQDEIDYFLSKLQQPQSEAYQACMSLEAKLRAEKIGDPETLDPSTVDLLPTDHWNDLDKPGRRILLTQVIMNQAIIECVPKIKEKVQARRPETVKKNPSRTEQ